MTKNEEHLVTDNVGLVYKYMALNNIDIDEHIDIFYEALVKAAKCFNEAVGATFATYAFKVFDSYRIRFSDEIYHTRTNKLLSTTNSTLVYLNSPMFLDNDDMETSAFVEDKVDYFENFDSIDQFSTWRNLITGKRREVLEMLILGLTYEQISQRMNITKQRISSYKIQLERNYKHYCKTGTIRNIKGESIKKKAGGKINANNSGIFNDI